MCIRDSPGTLVVRGSDGRGQCLTRPAGTEVPGVPVDPVADKLDPAITGARLPVDVHGPVLRLDLMGVVADVATRPGDVPAGSHDAWQVLAFVDPARVSRRARIAQQQRARVTVGDRLVFGRGVVHSSMGAESDVAMGVHETWKHPASHGLDVRARRRPVIGDLAPYDPELLPDLLRSDQNTSLDVQHRRGHARDPIHACLLYTSDAAD